MNAKTSMGLSLYEITDRYREAFYQLADSDLPDDAIDDTLAGIEGEFEIKAINVAAFWKNLDAEARAVKDAAKRMADRARILENKAERLRAYLLRNMDAAGIPEIKCPEHVLRLRWNPESIVIDDDKAIGLEFVIEEIVRKIDKRALLQAHKDGKAPVGAHVERKRRLEIK